ncbi:ABC-type bacteriocin/lantibiotic exporter with double-glycine peptidase domain [Mesoflavibacter sabulilitoris]|uniref:ABC transporter ATP-binding protein/permease n=1 Tax=Mesoflavibacter zeaxanthinifaciens subsp. sabulilitoris TaxID=1520893 RepID=A0A2T1NGR1_9FLAO|nr:ATP-binding cassette domain-containing protein [Mesoflavibacter zeaxanthinifaciens]MBB3122966.1 ABC-type bacteriocin/lantibiotic exporter with double-glycine peptidase domain [Mesoflavibacter zeaxanthinifaciens subsp. sabulilitoris]PSG91962.1 ABC transporter ATP-binding protein/permease [Mesoflavibacter zeaxanthinifaciens subsp. sabulilitoris]
MSKKILTAWQRFINLLKLDKKDLKQVFFYAIFAGLVNLSLPLGIQAIINLLQAAQVSTSWIVLVILVTLGVIFVGVLQLMQIRIIENIQQKIFTRASFDFAYRLPKIKMSALRGYYPPELVNRFFDTVIVQKGLAKILVDFPAAILQIIFGLLLLSFYHPFFIIYGVLLIVLMYIVFKYTAEKGLKTSIKESDHKYRVAHWLEEIARSIVSFKLSGKTNLALSKNDQLVTDYLDARESHFKVLVMQFIQLIGFKVLVTFGLLVIGGALVLNQQMNIGQFVAAEIIILLVINSVEKLILGLETFYDVLTSIEKLGKVVDKELEPQDGEIIDFDNKEFNLEFENIYYEVPDKETPILQNINLKINNKDRILVNGTNGSGKTSLLKLISGIIQPTKGNVFVNNHSLVSLNLNQYRAHLGQTLEEETPFEGTLKDNITFGDPSISKSDLDWAIQSVGLSNYVKHLPKGLNTILRPEGKEISYTTAKKIILARAIIKKPKLLVLKEPLDHFDQKEASKIIDFLIDKKHDWSLIVVSQNQLWENKLSKVVSLDNGQIINNK